MNQTQSKRRPFKRKPFPWEFAIIVAGLILLAGTLFIFVETIRSNQIALPTDAIMITAYQAFLFWDLTNYFHIRERKDKSAKVVSLIGLCFQLMHTALSMYGQNPWSLSGAYNYNERMLGVGVGFYVNCVLSLMWCIDWFMMGEKSFPSHVNWLLVVNRCLIATVVFCASFLLSEHFSQYLAMAVFGFLAITRIRSLYSPSVSLKHQ